MTPTAGVDEAQKNDQPITLGDLIDALAKRPPEDEVVFDFCGLHPTDVDSYRGYYDHLAIGYSTEYKPVKVAALLAELRAADGKVFTGYKGGDFRMDRDTPMWVANYGESGSTAVVGVAGDYQTVIRTAYCEDWEGAGERARKVLFGGLGWGNVR